LSEMELILVYNADSGFSNIIKDGLHKIYMHAQERARAIKRMAKEGKQNLSTNFLAAHGFKEGEGWSSFTPEKPMVIVKLEKIEQMIGLKSPTAHIEYARWP
jgi:hypothetical protein